MYIRKPPGPFAPPGRRRPSLKMTARSYSCTTCHHDDIDADDGDDGDGDDDDDDGDADDGDADDVYLYAEAERKWHGGDDEEEREK